MHLYRAGRIQCTLIPNPASHNASPLGVFWGLPHGAAVVDAHRVGPSGALKHGPERVADLGHRDSSEVPEGGKTRPLRARHWLHRPPSSRWRCYAHRE